MKMKAVTHTVREILELRRNKMLAVNPEYQRGPVWKYSQKKKLIDSIFRRYPIPLIYLHHIKRDVAGMKREDLEIIDGQQRINALHEFAENAFSLYDPDADEKEARFPGFIKEQPCLWAGAYFTDLSKELKDQFFDTPLAVAKIDTDQPDEARDLFIRLQSGMPLNAQEKRDAWPGGFNDFVLRVGGKPQIPRYRGHAFFIDLVGARTQTGRGKARQLCAQMAMLFFSQREHGKMVDISSRHIDDFYYTHLGFDPDSPEAKRFILVLDKLTQLLGDGKRPRLKGHEAIHLVLLVDSLVDEYTPSWQDRFAKGFDSFRAAVAKDKQTRHDENPGVFWQSYDQWTRTQSDTAKSILVRHYFFCKKMHESLSPLKPKDPNRSFGALEREIVYWRDRKICGICGGEVAWADAEVHHITPHSEGGPTTLPNAKLVHKSCHPRGRRAR